VSVTPESLVAAPDDRSPIFFAQVRRDTREIAPIHDILHLPGTAVRRRDRQDNAFELH
jgi:hypothetical protein